MTFVDSCNYFFGSSELLAEGIKQNVTHYNMLDIKTGRNEYLTTVSPCAKIVFLVRASLKFFGSRPRNLATLTNDVVSGISVVSKLSEKIKYFKIKYLKKIII